MDCFLFHVRFSDIFERDAISTKYPCIDKFNHHSMMSNHLLQALIEIAIPELSPRVGFKAKPVAKSAILMTFIAIDVYLFPQQLPRPSSSCSISCYSAEEIC